MVKNRENSLKNEARSLRKPTALDRIIEKVPKPRGAVPNFGLPKWKDMPLESKIPMIPGPEGSCIYTRKKLGEKLWVQTKNAEFNLNDPCNYEMEYSYDSLHDEHLTRYFSRECNFRRMLKLGLVTENLDAKCTLKDYNMYRKFLRKLHSDSINKELKRLDSLADERRVIEFTDAAAMREYARLNMEERKVIARDKAQEEAKKLEEKKLKERHERAEALRERLQSMETAKTLKQQERISKLTAKMEDSKRKRGAALTNARAKVIETLIEWSKKESNRRRARKERLAREDEAKHREIQEKWNRRMESEELEVAKKKSTLRYVEVEREKFIKNYTKKVERQRANMQKRFENIKKFLRCNMARGVTGGRKRTCCR